MAWRIRAKLRFPAGTNFAQTFISNNAGRGQRAINIKPGQINAEASYLREIDGILEADVFFASEQDAVDTFNSAVSILNTANLLPAVDDNYSFISVHECLHDQTPQQPCTNITLSWSDI